jgi:hypothetical protein
VLNGLLNEQENLIREQKLLDAAIYKELKNLYFTGKSNNLNFDDYFGRRLKIVRLIEEIGMIIQKIN